MPDDLWLQIAARLFRQVRKLQRRVDRIEGVAPSSAETPSPDFGRTVPVSSDDTPPPARRKQADPCRVAVLRALHSASARMSKQELIEAMAKAGDEFSDRKVDYALSELKDEGILDNPKVAGKHLGYGFSWQK